MLVEMIAKSTTTDLERQKAPLDAKLRKADEEVRRLEAALTAAKTDYTYVNQKDLFGHVSRVRVTDDRKISEARSQLDRAKRDRGDILREQKKIDADIAAMPLRTISGKLEDGTLVRIPVVSKPGVELLLTKVDAMIPQLHYRVSGFGRDVKGELEIILSDVTLQ